MSTSALYVGCDVSKGYADFIVLSQDKSIVEDNFGMDDTAKGHAALEKLLCSLHAAHPAATIFVGMESTGGFENNWLAALQRMAAELPIKTARINPCPVKKHLDAEMKRTRTDEVSSWGIAGFMIAHPDKVLYDQDDPFYSCRRQWKTLRLLKKQKSQLLNQLHSFLYSANPGVLMHCRHGIAEWLLTVLDRWPTATLLARAKVTTLSKIPYLTLTRAEKLIQRARNDVASQTDDMTAFTIRQIIIQIRNLDTSIDLLENSLKERWKNHPAMQLLTSFKGIGDISALGLLINIRDHTLYPDASYLASYFGLHPVYRKSGDGVWGFHMSKQGRAEPRAILYMVARTAVVFNPLIRELYHKSLKDGKKKMSALGICMHKILRIVYGMLRTNTPFDSEIDKRNRSKHPATSTKDADAARHRKVRRFQEADTNAPISYRQAKKRRANGSQVALLRSAGSPFPSLSQQNSIPQNSDSNHTMNVKEHKKPDHTIMVHEMEVI